MLAAYLHADFYQAKLQLVAIWLGSWRLVNTGLLINCAKLRARPSCLRECSLMQDTYLALPARP